LLRCIPAELVRKYRALPVSESGHCITIVMPDPSDLPAVDRLHSALNREIYLCIANKAQIDSFIEWFYGDKKSTA